MFGQISMPAVTVLPRLAFGAVLPSCFELGFDQAPRSGREKNPISADRPHVAPCHVQGANQADDHHVAAAFDSVRPDPSGPVLPGVWL